MPSTFRSSRSGRHLEGPNRTRNGQIDHDVFEGLPVRRWARQPHTFSQAPKTAEDNEIGIQGPGGTTTLPELPMPQDSGLLPPISKALLRAARAGCIYIRQSGRSSNEEGKETTDAEDQSTATIHMADRSFTSRKWMTLPKNMEPPEVEFLAKRRPGLPSLYGGAAAVDGGAPGPMRRTKFKKVDPETGNISIYEAWVPEGHRIEGEVTGDVQSFAEQSEVPVKPEAPAPGTVVEGVGVVNSEGVVVAEAGSAAVMTPPKRRPPPPKRKGKGIGKGRKKKVMFAPGEGADAATVHGVAPNAGGGADGAREGQEGSQMSVDQSGQEEDEEYGEEGEESDEGDETMTDAKTPETPQAQSGTESTPQPSTDNTPADTKDVDMADGAPEEPSTLGSPAVAGQDAASQPEVAPAFDTSQTDASASATPAPPAEKAEEGAPEKPTDTSEQAAPEQTTGEAAPKEESQAPEPTNFPEASGVDSTVEGKPAPHEADMTASEVKTEDTPSGVDAGLSAPASVGPEEPKEEPSGAEQSADSTQQPQAEPVSTESEVGDVQAPESSEVEESKDDVQTNDVPAASDPQPTHTDDSTEPASPAPPTTTTEAEPSVPQLTETEPTDSKTLDAAPPSDGKAEEAAPEPEPAPAQPESASEEKKEEDSEATPAPAAESA